MNRTGFGIMRRIGLFCAGVTAVVALMLAVQPARRVRAQDSGPDGLVTPPPGPGGGLSPYVTLPPSPKRSNPLERLAPVTDAQLIHPPDSDWLTWRRTYDDWGFSPLKQINRGNAADLRVAWSWALPPGPNEMTPLVHDGVLFVFGFGDRVQALDAA